MFGTRRVQSALASLKSVSNCNTHNHSFKKNRKSPASTLLWPLDMLSFTWCKLWKNNSSNMFCLFFPILKLSDFFLKHKKVKCTLNFATATLPLQPIWLCTFALRVFFLVSQINILTILTVDCIEMLLSLPVSFTSKGAWKNMRGFNTIARMSLDNLKTLALVKKRADGFLEVFA